MAPPWPRGEIIEAVKGEDKVLVGEKGPASPMRSGESFKSSGKKPVEW